MFINTLGHSYFAHLALPMWRAKKAIIHFKFTSASQSLFRSATLAGQYMFNTLSSDDGPEDDGRNSGSHNAVKIYLGSRWLLFSVVTLRRSAAQEGEKKEANNGKTVSIQHLCHKGNSHCDNDTHLLGSSCCLLLGLCQSPLDSVRLLLILRRLPLVLGRPPCKLVPRNQ